MKLRYKIVIAHLTLYILSYLTLILYHESRSPIDLGEIPEAIFEAIKEVMVILISLIIIPIVGFLIGLAFKNKEMKFGFFISTINAIFIIALVYIFG